jgi:hypothetical protein
MLSHRIRSIIALSFLLISACDSRIEMSASPALTPLTDAQAIPAIITDTLGGGQLVTVDNITLLPKAVQEARELKVAFGRALIDVNRTNGGFFTFVIPPNASIQKDINGTLKLVFVINDEKSQIVTLKTGSPVTFAQPPVQTIPENGAIIRSNDITLKANTNADPAKFQFTWAYSQSPNGGWQNISGEGKEVLWTPPVAGNFYIKIDTIDRQTRQTYSTITPSAAVFTTDDKTIIRSNAPFAERGDKVTLSVNTAAAGNGPFSWFYSKATVGNSFAAPSWEPIPGADLSASTSFVAVDSGPYLFRVDTPRADGSIKSITQSEPVLTARESTPIIQTDPPNTKIDPGSAVTLVLKVRGLNASTYNYSWSVSTSPSFGFSSLPINEFTGLTEPRYVWSTRPGVTQPGNYYVKVDAVEKTGTARYSFVSNAPVVLIETP